MSSGSYKIAAAMIAAAAIAAMPGRAQPPESNVSAGTTIKDAKSGWRASLFVTSFGGQTLTDDGTLRLRPSSIVNARLSRDLTKRSRLVVDVFNVLDRRAGTYDAFEASQSWGSRLPGDEFLFHPGEPLALRLRLQIRF